MPKIKKPKKVFISNVHQVFKEAKFKGRVSRLQVIQWNVDGKDTAKKMERRDYHIRDVEGAEKITMGRGGGLTKEDLLYVIAHWDEIVMFF